jgi:ABC-type hemin transport system substrate-binding protein
MAAERDGMLEGGDEDFAVRAGSQMSAYFSANVGREFVVDIGGQLLEKVYATAFAMRMVGRRWTGSEPFLRR